jgi:hypothetical protein
MIMTVMTMRSAYRGGGVPEGLAVEQPHDVSRRHRAHRLALHLLRLSGRQWRRWFCDSHNAGLHCNTRMWHVKEHSTVREYVKQRFPGQWNKNNAKT